uniref:Uncharacterized protein n=1 Tax=Tanacetum cinerariifolium TaxID=118510 RepID=A0A699IK82_TANCI|nr:hypothetical protein [Tanacetum cinerariifolium]
MLVIKRFRERKKIVRERKLSENFILRGKKMRLVTHGLEGYEFEEDELVAVMVKVVHGYCMMVVKKIKNGLLKEVEMSLFWKKVMILEWMSCVSILVLPTFLVFKRSWNGGLSKTLMMKERG